MGASSELSGGREFQRWGADLLKALNLMVVKLADRAESWMAARVWKDMMVQG